VSAPPAHHHQQQQHRHRLLHAMLWHKLCAVRHLLVCFRSALEEVIILVQLTSALTLTCCSKETRFVDQQRWQHKLGA
jgi:hypothetical protein